MIPFLIGAAWGVVTMLFGIVVQEHYDWPTWLTLIVFIPLGGVFAAATIIALIKFGIL